MRPRLQPNLLPNCCGKATRPFVPREFRCHRLDSLFVDQLGVHADIVYSVFVSLSSFAKYADCLRHAIFTGTHRPSRAKTVSAVSIRAYDLKHTTAGLCTAPHRRERNQLHRKANRKFKTYRRQWLAGSAAPQS